ncbi:hypothetical protein ACTXT7_005853 [Hymenolepis weldensis]
MRAKLPTLVIVFGIVSSEGGAHHDSSIFFHGDLRVNANTDAYVETLQTIVIKPPWIDGVANGRPHVFQQDSAPSLKALKIQDWMDGREFSSSCHTKHTLILWIVTYGVGRGFVEEEVNKHLPYTKSSSLMEAMARAMEDINKDHLVKASSRLRTRIEWNPSKSCYKSSSAQSVFEFSFDANLERRQYYGERKGLTPRLLGEVITVWLTAGMAYVVNRYLFPEGSDPKFKEQTPYIASSLWFAYSGFDVGPHCHAAYPTNSSILHEDGLTTNSQILVVSSCTHRLTVTSTVMAVSGSGLSADVPFKNSLECYNYLSTRNAFLRGASFFFRYAAGPL